MFRKVLDSSVVPIALIYQAAGFNGLEKTVMVTSQELYDVIAVMRRRLAEDGSSGQQLRDFFFVTWDMGLKVRFASADSYADALQHLNMNWQQVDRNEQMQAKVTTGKVVGFIQ